MEYTIHPNPGLDQSQSPLLRLPTEVRLLVWSFLFHRRCLHVLANDRVWCATTTFNASHHLGECHRHLLPPTLRCTYCPSNPVAAIAATSRLFYSEVALLRYERTLLCFVSSSVCLAYLRVKLSTHYVTGFSFERIRHLQLDLGPAKYIARGDSEQNYSVLTLLARHATCLVTLNLNFTWYYRAPFDALPLNRKTITCLLKLRGLRNFNLRMYQVLPGPTGLTELRRKLLTRFWKRWRCMEAVIRLQVSPGPHPSTSTVDTSTNLADLLNAVRDYVGNKTVTFEVVRNATRDLVPDV